MNKGAFEHAGFVMKSRFIGSDKVRWSCWRAVPLMPLPRR
jgi:hypothetical protein